MKWLSYLCLMLMCGMLYSQEVDPEVDPKEEMKKALKAAEDASKAMEEAEKALSEASREKTRPDVIHERVKKILQQLKDGKLDELPPGIEDYLKSKNKPIDLEILNKDPEFLKKIANDDELINILTKKQLEAEDSIQESLKIQQETSDEAIKKMEESLNAISKSASGSKNSQIDNKNNKNNKTDSNKTIPPGGTEPQPNNDPKSSEKPEPKDSEFESRQPDSNDSDGFQAPTKNKEVGPGSSGDSQSEPSKYKGFWQKWAETMQKRTRFTPKKKD